MNLKTVYNIGLLWWRFFFYKNNKNGWYARLPQATYIIDESDG